MQHESAATKRANTKGKIFPSSREENKNNNSENVIVTLNSI